LVNGVVQVSNIPADYTGCLYTTPPAAKQQWVGLSQDEVLSIGKELGLKCKLGGNANIDLDYAEAIEARLKGKNT
jgi:hypothetical protein